MSRKSVTRTMLVYLPQWIAGNVIGSVALVLVKNGHERAGMRLAGWAAWIWRGVPLQ